MKAQVAVRADLSGLIARACRAMAVAGLFDMHGHISVRDGEVIYINDRRSSRATLRPDQVAVVRIEDGTPLHGEPPARPRCTWPASALGVTSAAPPTSTRCSPPPSPWPAGRS